MGFCKKDFSFFVSSCLIFFLACVDKMARFSCAFSLGGEGTALNLCHLINISSWELSMFSTGVVFIMKEIITSFQHYHFLKVLITYVGCNGMSQTL